MRKVTLLIATIVIAGLCACQHSKGDEPDNPEGTNTITRPKDGNEKVFLEKGILVNGTTNFTATQLNQALSQMNWKQVYFFYYDDKNVGDIYPYYNDFLPQRFATDGNIYFGPKNGLYPKVYIQSGNKFTVDFSASSVALSHNEYTIVAVDCSPTLKRIIVDRKKAQYSGFSPIPKEFDQEKASIRKVFLPE